MPLVILIKSALIAADVNGVDAYSTPPPWCPFNKSVKLGSQIVTSNGIYFEFGSDNLLEKMTNDFWLRFVLKENETIELSISVSSIGLNNTVYEFRNCQGKIVVAS